MTETSERKVKEIYTDIRNLISDLIDAKQSNEQSSNPIIDEYEIIGNIEEKVSELIAWFPKGLEID